MHIFANGFSNKLSREATKHRPAPIDLPLSVVTRLSRQAGYHLMIREDPKESHIYHPDGVHTLDNGLCLHWLVRPSQNARGLVFYPSVHCHTTRGTNPEVIEEMYDRLGISLPSLGYLATSINLDEEIITLPDELRNPTTSISVMYLSEFKANYRDLYIFLKSKIDPGY